MGNIDKGCFDFLMQLCDFRAHLGTQLCVQIGERLVQKEHFRGSQDGASQRNALSLTAGKVLGLSLQIFFQFQYFRRPKNLFVDLGLRNMTQAQTKRKILINGHVRIQRIVLENHRNIPVFRLYMIGEGISDIDLACSNILQPSDHAKRRRFAATGGTDKHDELLVFDFHVEVVDRFDAVGIYLIQMP